MRKRILELFRSVAAGQEHRSQSAHDGHDSAGGCAPHPEPAKQLRKLHGKRLCGRRSGGDLDGKIADLIAGILKGRAEFPRAGDRCLRSSEIVSAGLIQNAVGLLLGDNPGPHRCRKRFLRLLIAL
ncbi:hypothetical protein DWF04_021495 [Cereibacter sphaeroides f. sp. denitrificans]